jgi:hypothetical protein
MTDAFCRFLGPERNGGRGGIGNGARRALAADRLLASYAAYADRVAVRAELHKATVELLRAIKAIESCPKWPTPVDK